MRRILLALGLIALVAACVWLYRSNAERADAAPGVDPWATRRPTTATRSSADLADVDPRAAESSADPRVAAASFADEPALLRVLVLSRADGAPVPGAFVTALDLGVLAAGPRSVNPPLDPPRASGVLFEGLTTDSEGRVEIRVDVASPLQVSARMPYSLDLQTSAQVSALPRNAVREIELVVETHDGFSMCCRVVDRESRRPIAGAQLGPSSNPLSFERAAEAVTGDDGAACVKLTSSSRLGLTVLAPGYGPVVVTPRRDCGDPAHALPIEMLKSASASVRVLDAMGRSMPFVTVELNVEARHLILDAAFGERVVTDTVLDASWTVATNDDGVARFYGLPAHSPIRGRVLRDGDEIWKVESTFSLEPAQDANLDWHIGIHCAIHGRATESDGSPAKEVVIALEPAWTESGAYFLPYPRPERREATTDAQGTFAFADVAAGSWWLGPAPTRAGNDAPVAARDVAPFGRLVRVLPDAARVDVEVHVQRGKTIRGRVVTPDGAVCTENVVLVVAGIDEPSWMMFDPNPRDGSFEVGPLVDGTYDIVAQAFRSGSAPSEHVRAMAGTVDLIIALRRGAMLRGSVLDAKTRKPTPARLLVSHGSGLDGRWTGHHSKPDGSFELEGLEAGEVVLVATTSDGRCGATAPMTVTAGSRREDLEMLVRPGATVRVVNRDPSPAVDVRVLQKGATFATDGIERGAEARFPAPAGEVTVRVTEYPGPVNRDVVIQLTAGETRELVYDGGWK